VKAAAHKQVEKYRVTGPFGQPADSRLGNNGAFKIPCGDVVLTVLVSDGSGCEEADCPEEIKPAGKWEHVSVSLPNRTPTWTEMCFIKDVFWGEEEVVFQLHPAKSRYVNIHPFVLHLWRHKRCDPPKPPLYCV
jgi:hypothetical protein